MPTVYIAPGPINSTQLIPGGSTPASGGKLFQYLSGSSTKTDTYTNVTGTVKWSNPIILDSGGNLGGSNEVWIPAGVTAKFVLAPSNDTDPPIAPYKTWDNLSGINDPTSLLTEWVVGPTPTFVSTTSFTLVGDQTLIFTPGRRVKTTNTAGTRYGTISTSVFGAVTTVTIINDSGTLDAGLSAVWYGILSVNHDSIPNVVNVMRFGALGDGVTDDTAAITAAIASIPATGGTIYFPRGTYAYATSPNFAKLSLSIIGESNQTIFKHTGTGNAFLVDAGANPAFINYLNFQKFQIQGNTNSTNGMYLRGIGRSLFSDIWVTGCATTGAALRCDFALLNTWTNFKVSNSVPVPLNGILLTRRNVGENTTTQIFINSCIESVTTAGGAGIFIDWAGTNTFIGGTSESNDTGLWITANGPGFNEFYGTDLEVNAVNDINLLGTTNYFYGMLSLGTTAVGATATDNSFFGGKYTVFTINGSAVRTKLFGPQIATSLTATPPSTTLLEVFVNAAFVPNQLETDTVISGKITSAKTANDTLSDTNAFLKLFDATLGAGLFGQQKLSSPFHFVLIATNAAFSTIFPIALGSKLYPVTDANAVQTACGIYAGTGAPNNANGANGDIYIRSDGGALTTIYQRRAGAWVGIV